MLGTEEITDKIINTDNETETQKHLILFDDDVNDFDFIVIRLIEVCKFDAEQANSYTLEAHFEGKSCIKKGTFDELEPYQNALARQNITTEIQ